MEELRLLTLRVINYVLDFIVFLTAFTLGVLTFLFQKVGEFHFVHMQNYKWSILAMLYLIFYGCGFFSLAYFRLYHSHTLHSPSKAMQLYLKSTAMALLTSVLIAFFFPFLAASRVMLLSASVYAFCLLLIKEHYLRRILVKLKSNERFQRRTVVVGSNSKALDEINKRCTPDLLVGLNIIGTVWPQMEMPDESADSDPQKPCLGSLANLGALLDKNCVDIVVVVGSDVDPEMMEKTIKICEKRGLELWINLDILNRVLYKAELSDVWGISFVNFQSVPQDVASLFIKAAFDRAVSLTLIILLAPLMLIITLLIRLFSQGSVIFVQDRAGINGKKFRFYKFRSMYVDAENQKQEVLEQNENTGPAFKLKDDPRITSLGKCLRKTSLDELPQLFNVLKGDMSLVGPRPLPLEEVKEFDSWHRRRLSMRPGITGLWQVSGRSDIVDFNNWAAMDLQYIDSWSLSLDLVILLRTIPAVLTMRGAR